MSKRRIDILLVEDKKFMYDLIEGYIMSNPTTSLNGIDYEFSVDISTKGNDAILKYAKTRHHIVIMDLDLDEKDINGIIASKEILEINPNAKIIGMASEGDALIDDFKKCGIRNFVEKPFQDTYIWTRINYFVDDIFKENSQEDFDNRKKKKSIWKKLF